MLHCPRMRGRSAAPRPVRLSKPQRSGSTRCRQFASGSSSRDLLPLGRKDCLALGAHVDDGPPLRVCLVERPVQPTSRSLAVVRPFVLGVGGVRGQCRSELAPSPPLSYPFGNRCGLIETLPIPFGAGQPVWLTAGRERICPSSERGIQKGGRPALSRPPSGSSGYWPGPLLAAAASAILFPISALMASRLKLAPRCIGG